MVDIYANVANELKDKGARGRAPLHLHILYRHQKALLADDG